MLKAVNIISECFILEIIAARGPPGKPGTAVDLVSD